MDSVPLSKIFRRLLSHQTCSKLRYHDPTPRKLNTIYYGRRYYRKSRGDEEYREDKQLSNWQQRTEILPPDKLQEYQKAPMVNANGLRSRRERPKGVKMLTRDFIDDSLYNPNYGYFPKHATIFTPGKPFDFNALADEPAFHRELGKRYTSFEDDLDAESFNETRQLWHTPTELFLPYYGEAIARYLVTNYKLSHHPYHDLIIYELGAGNGTLMLNILDYIRDYHPDVYPRTKFKVIEISSALATLQTNQLTRTASSRGHVGHVEIINRSIFAWDTYLPAPCYFLALEVFDNFAHDSIRYDPITEVPLQGTVLIDAEGSFYDFYVRDIDPEVRHFLQVRHAACTRSFDHPLQEQKWLRAFKSSLPFAPNLTHPEYIPTRLLQFFEILHQYFPLHQLLTSDFHSLPGTVKGFNAPAVQTRYKRRTVPVTTPYVMQGYFDILFPTNFAMMEDLYRAVTGKLTKVTSHAEWLRRWAYTEDTQCKSGENPMLSWYENSSVMLST
ncbi:uncharacterized protein KY384_008532 [Bacidia gigantensis]|uniref:uncharacterized protein n=1 Tax=Bacidia gigantensis TaxID=2732470 RepID=UPI001D03755A|nr:uncharacterized protein KY384_008532 [Bacidia gigantensis]KAG8527103.1 hypothetical protein KY384_008532 [Bacidia gigantensis]